VRPRLLTAAVEPAKTASSAAECDSEAQASAEGSADFPRVDSGPSVSLGRALLAGLGAAGSDYWAWVVASTDGPVSSVSLSVVLSVDLGLVGSVLQAWTVGWSAVSELASAALALSVDPHLVGSGYQA